MPAYVLVLSLMAASGEPGRLYPPMGPPFETWISDGRPLAVIVSDPFPNGVVRPADVLNEYLEKIAGCRLPAVAEAPAGAPTVYLGPKAGLSRLTEDQRRRIGPEGFAIVSRGRDLVIAGRSRLATIYGVCAFLEECLGVRWFWDGPGGEYVPQTKTLRIGRIERIENPDFRWRWVGRGRWAMFNRMNAGLGDPDEFKTWRFVHTFLDLVPPEKYWKRHPEYYALLGGSRADPTDRSRQVQLCTSNPAVAEAVVETIRQILGTDPAVRMISVDPMDSNRFCQCQSCRALDEPGAPYPRKYSRRLVLFYNRVADLVRREFPDVLIKSIAYSTYVAPPADESIKVRDNVVIQFCRFQCHNHALNDPACPLNRRYNAYLLGWKRIARNVAMYEYYFKVSWLNLPWPIVHTLRRDIPYLRDLGIMGVATQYGYNFASNGLVYYVAAKLLWDADLDVDALLADFYEKAYGPAAAAMRRYHERLERAAVASGVHLAYQRPYRDVLKVFTPDVLADLDAAMAEARRAARGTPAAERVELMAVGLRYTHLVVDYLQTVASVRRKVVQDRWMGAVTRQLADEARRLAAPKAAAIRQFYMHNRDSRAIGFVNSYVKLLLDPGRVLAAWQQRDEPAEDVVVLTKLQWLRRHRQEMPAELPQSMELWVYGYDLDFVAGKPEHTLLAELPDGRQVAVGHVGSPELPGDGKNVCYVIEGLSPGVMDGRRLRLTITNDPGGPWASRIFAVYLMPPTGLGPAAATAKVEGDVEWVRRKALGFVEFAYEGLVSRDGDRKRVEIVVPEAGRVLRRRLGRGPLASGPAPIAAGGRLGQPAAAAARRGDGAVRRPADRDRPLPCSDDRPARGVTLYVSKLGDDTDGRSWATAFRTIQRALDAIPDDGGGHRVIVRPDVYCEANLAPAFRGARGAYNHLIGDTDGRFGSGRRGWVVVDSSDPDGRGMKSYDWWGPIRAYKHGWSPEHTGQTFSARCWDRWHLRGLYMTGGDAGVFFDLVDETEPLSLVVEDCVGVGRAFGGGVAGCLARDDEPILFRRCYLAALDWWGDTAAAYVRTENDRMPAEPQVFFEDCVMVSPQCALKAGNYGFHTFTHVAARRCYMIVLNFSQPRGTPTDGVIQSVQAGRYLSVDLEDCTLLGYKVFGVSVEKDTVGEITCTTRGDVKAYVQFQQSVPEGFLRLGWWPAEVFEAIAPPRRDPPDPFISRELVRPRRCEVSPLLWRGRLIYLECVRPAMGGDPEGHYLEIRDADSGRRMAKFAVGYGLPSAIVHDGKLYVFASRWQDGGWHDVTVFVSDDLSKWESRVVIRGDNEQIFNTSVCRGPDGFVMAYETNDPAYPPFTIKFARSPDLLRWQKIPGAVFGADRYAACPCIRYGGEHYYMLYLERRQPRWFFETYVARSRDLRRWELAAANPVISPRGLDEGVNASDPEIIELDGQTHLYYAVGDQRTWMNVKRAVYPGTMQQFFEHWFAEGAVAEIGRQGHGG